MHSIFKLMLLAVTSAFLLGGCEDITEIFFVEDPAETSSCQAWAENFFLDEDELLCVECNSDTVDEASDELCGAEITARCNSDGPVLFGIALALVGVEDEPINVMTATAWIDDDDPSGPSEGDEIVCHEQSVEMFGKQEYKCTTELNGNGKNGGITFEAEVKYDPLNDDCMLN